MLTSSCDALVGAGLWDVGDASIIVVDVLVLGWWLLLSPSPLLG